MQRESGEPKDENELEISVRMSQAGGRAVVLFLEDYPLETFGVGWHAKLAAAAYRAMRAIHCEERNLDTSSNPQVRLPDQECELPSRACSLV